MDGDPFSKGMDGRQLWEQTFGLNGTPHRGTMLKAVANPKPYGPTASMPTLF